MVTNVHYERHAAGGVGPNEKYRRLVLLKMSPDESSGIVARDCCKASVRRLMADFYQNRRSPHAEQTDDKTAGQVGQLRHVVSDNFRLVKRDEPLPPGGVN